MAWTRRAKTDMGVIVKKIGELRVECDWEWRRPSKKWMRVIGEDT